MYKHLELQISFLNFKMTVDSLVPQNRLFEVSSDSKLNIMNNLIEQMK